MLTTEQEEILWEKNIFGEHLAENLLHSFFSTIANISVFAAVMSMHVNQIQIGADDSGHYIEFLGKNNKTYTGGLHHRHITPKYITVNIM